MVRNLLVGSIAAATAMLAHTAGAQQPGVRALEEIIVTSTTRRAESLGDINASVAVLSEEELRQIAHTHFQEALARLPGVNISRNNGQESLIAIRSPVLTGPGACGNFLTAEEGIPLRAAGFCNVNEMFDSNTENAERIEVIRGPATAFYGSNALNGMINTVLPDPQERLDVTLEAGPWGSYRAGVVAGFDSGNFKHMFLATGQNAEGWQDDSGVDQQKLSWVYQYETAGGFQLDGGFTRTNLNQETGGYVVGPDAYKDASLRDTNPNPEAYRDNESFRIWTRVSKELENDWEVVFTPYFREVNLNFIQHFLPGDPTEDSEHRSLGFQFASYKDFSNNSFLALGLDVESTDGRLFQFQENPTQGSAFLQNTIPQGAHYDYEVEAFQIAPFVHYQYYVSEQLDISLGLRWERMDYEYDNLMIDGRTKDNGEACGFGGCRYSRPADRDDDFDNVSPKLGVRYRFNDQHNVQARAQRGFRAPQATELYRLQGANPDVQVARLDSVELDSYELAFEGFGNGWEYSVTGYYMEKKNDIGTDSSRAKVTDNETEHKGIEFAGAYSLTENLTLLATYNFAEHTYEKDFVTGEQVEGNDVDTAPNNFGNFRLNWQITPTISTELEWVNMGEYYTNPQNTADYSGHDVYNLRTNWAVNEDLNVSLRILNLADEEYAERADWTTFQGDRYFVGQPLRAFLSFSYSIK
ncbi:MAG: TonB-dependent receptor [Gammaproteobacteria bacterium]|nr:TonB-dependent receptor [Gammaproteobacteria bacterium]